MTTRAFYEPEAGLIRSDAKSDAYFGLVQEASTREDAATFDEEMDDLCESYKSGMGCVRGMRSAIAIEAAVVLAIYGIWELSHLLR